MKTVLKTVVAASLLASGLTFAVVTKTESNVDAANPNKITICHRTAAVNNPYRRITVNKSSIASDITKEAQGKQGHGQWSHNLWPTHVADNDDVTKRPDPNVFNPAWEDSVYQIATQKRWGDIIPLRLDNNTPNPNVDGMGLNYKDAGLAIYDGTSFGGVNYGGLCKRQTATQFCESLIAEGGTLAECQEELAEMEAVEDKEVEKACGGSFVGCSLETMSTITVRTVGVTCVADVPTLSGAVSTGTLLNEVSFEYGADAFLSGATTINGTPATITGVGTFTATLPALSDAKYYYRAVSIEPLEGSRLDGSIATFTIANSECTDISGGEPETPAPKLPPAGFNGALKGVVWIDQNRNGKQDSDEPGLPFTPLVAEIVTSSVSSQGVGQTSPRPTVRKLSITTTTDANGFYNVASLEPGSWKVTATLQTQALEKTFDSTNGSTTSWLASAVVPINGVGEADFAAAGNARIALVVEPSATCSKAKSIEVQWAGIDNKINTKDDVVFMATVTQQEALVRGLPWGSYLVTPICADGTRLASQTLVITKAQSTKVTKLSIDLAPAVLPATGAPSTTSMMALSVMLIISGVVVLALPRRRRNA